MLFSCNGILQNVFYATCVAATITIAILAIFWSNTEKYDNSQSESNTEKFAAEYMDADEFYRHSIYIRRLVGSTDQAYSSGF